MPKIEEIAFDVAPIGSLLPRSEGKPHVTSILHAIESSISTGSKSGKPDFSRLSEWYGELGFVWEEALSVILGKRFGNRPGEIELDGVVGSPDGLLVRGRKSIGQEFKLTWRGYFNPLDDWYFTHQMGAYCSLMDVREMELYILHANGNYRDQRGPRGKAFKLTFSNREVKEIWEMVLNHKYLIGENND